MTARITIYAGPPLGEALAPFERDRWSARANAIAARYLYLARASCPVLRETEWTILLDALRGVDAQEVAGWAAMLPQEVRDSAEPDAEGEPPDPARLDLADRLESLRPAERVAILEVVERFWAAVRQGGGGAGTARLRLLLGAGARVLDAAGEEG